MYHVSSMSLGLSHTADALVRGRTKVLRVITCKTTSTVLLSHRLQGGTPKAVVLQTGIM